MIAAIYLRQSQDRTDEGKAVARQLEDCQKVCQQRGWEWQPYEDNDTSASSGKPRPAYERMLQDIRDGKIGAVVCWHLDRLTRRPIELEHFMDLADTHRLALATVTGDVNLASDDGRFMARIMGAVAKKEIDRKSARQKRAARQHAESGGGWGGRRAFGYTKRDNDIQRDEAKLIRKAYTAILAGESLYSIAAQWNAAGVTTTVGNQWSGSTVRQMLVSPRYAGKRSYQGEVVADATWKPVVSDDVWQSVHGILTDSDRRRNRAPGRKYLLTGILLCGKCDDGTTMGSGVANSDGARIYVCKTCHRLSRRLEPVDRIVEGLAVGYLSRPDAIDILTDAEVHDVGELRERERVLLDGIDKLAVDRAKGYLTGRQVMIATRELEGELTEVRSKMRSANRLRVFDGLEEAIARGAVRQWWDGLVLDRQRAILPILMIVKLKPMGRGRPFDRTHLDYKWLTGDD